MKKLLVIAAVLALVPMAHAETFRFFLGPVISTYTGQWPNSALLDGVAFKGNLDPFRNSKTGSIDGLGIEFPLCKGLGLEIDGYYFNEGAKFTGPFAGFTAARETYTLQGLGFPVLLKIRPLPRYYPYLLAGAQVSFILSHDRITYVQRAGSPFFEEILEEDLSVATKKFDFGPVVGVGFEFPISKWALFVEARYRAGIVDLIKDFPALGHAARLRVFAIIIGYKL